MRPAPLPDPPFFQGSLEPLGRCVDAEKRKNEKYFEIIEISKFEIENVKFGKLEKPNVRS